MSYTLVNEVIKNTALPPREKLVLIVFATYGDKDGFRVFPSIGRVAHETGFSRRTVQRTVATLEKLGILYRWSDGSRALHQTCQWKIEIGQAPILAPFESNAQSPVLLAEPADSDLAEVSTGAALRVTTSPSRASGSPTRVSPSPAPGDHESPNPVTNKSKNPSDRSESVTPRKNEEDVELLARRWENLCGKRPTRKARIELHDLIDRGIPNSVITLVIDDHGASGNQWETLRRPMEVAVIRFHREESEPDAGQPA